MDGSFHLLLEKADTSVNDTCLLLSKSLRISFLDLGLESSKIDTLLGAATKASNPGMDLAFRQMQRAITKLQRKLTRSMLPKIRKRMTPAYFAAMKQRGQGTFNRMKHMMKTKSTPMLASMFQDSLSQMEKKIFEAITQIGKSILDTAELMKSKMETILSLAWDLEQSKALALGDNLRTELQHLIDAQKQAVDLLEADADDEIESKEPDANKPVPVIASHKSTRDDGMKEIHPVQSLMDKDACCEIVEKKEPINFRGQGPSDNPIVID